jgi:hypothetical protein
MQTTKKILILVISIFISISLTACGNGLSDRQLTKILKENGYTPNKAKVLSVVDCPSNIEGLENGNNKFVLTSDTVNGTTNHEFCIINTDTRHITDIPFQYTPLNFVQQGIWLKDNITNMNCFNIARKYIEKYGVNAFTDKDHAEEYLRELTKNNHIINTVEAQDIINNSVTQIFPKITSPDDVTVFYEDNSAVPLYYATESTDMVYNWNGIFDESVYKVWAASTDRESQSIMQAMYGSPYVMKECVAVVDSNMNQIGTFKSMDEAKSQLKGKKSSSNNTTQDKTSNQATNNTSENSNNSPDTTTNTNTTTHNTSQQEYTQKELYYLNHFYRAKHILITETTSNAENLYNELYERAKNGEDFDTLIDKYSEDPGCQTNPNGYFFQDK